MSFLNLAEWLWCKSKARIRRTFRRPVESYFRRKVIPMYKSFAISFNSRDILFITLKRYFRHKEHGNIYDPNYILKSILV